MVSLSHLGLWSLFSYRTKFIIVSLQLNHLNVLFIRKPTFIAIRFISVMMSFSAYNFIFIATLPSHHDNAMFINRYKFKLIWSNSFYMYVLRRLITWFCKSVLQKLENRTTSGVHTYSNCRRRTKNIQKGAIFYVISVCKLCVRVKMGNKIEKKNMKTKFIIFL